MGSEELAANLFRITQTDEVLKNNHVSIEQVACATHHMVVQAVRQTIKKSWWNHARKLTNTRKINKIIRKI